AVLVLAVGRLFRSSLSRALRILEKVRTRVELVIANELESGAVKLVSPAAGGDVHLPGGASELGGIDPRLDLEFLEGFDGREDDIEIEIDVGVGDPVERVVAPRSAGPGERHGYAGAGSALASGRLGGGREAVGHIGAERHKAEKVAPVQRQL